MASAFVELHSPRSGTSSGGSAASVMAMNQYGRFVSQNASLIGTGSLAATIRLPRDSTCTAVTPSFRAV